MDNDGDRSPELVEAPADPLTDRLAQFRASGDDRAAAGAKPLEEEETEETSEETQEETEGAEETEEEQEGQETEEEGQEEERNPDEPDYEKPAEGEGGEGETAEEGEEAGEAGQTFALDFLNVAALKDPKSPHAAVLHLEGLPQDYRDSIAAHVKRSQQYDSVVQRLEKARELETVARFYSADPLNAMRLVAVEKPELAQEFVANWVLQNPKAALAMIRQHKLESDDAEKLELRGRVARSEMMDSLGKAYDGVRTQTAEAEFLEGAAATVDELIEPLDLSTADQELFADAAAATVQRAMKALSARGQSPHMPKAELVSLLQPLVQRFAGKPTAAGTPKGGAPKPKAKKPLTREQMAEKAKRADELRRLQGGARTPQQRARPEALRKSKLPRDMGERIKLLRAGKL